MRNKVHWIKIQIQCNGEIAESLAEVLGRFVSNGVVMESVAEFDSKTHDPIPTGEILVSGYLAVNEHLEEKRQQLEEALWHLSQISPIPEPIYSPVHDEDWMAAWKEHYAPVPVGEKVMIKSAWDESEVGDGRVVIRINPAMAFGTGTHPTTQLCLRLLERYLVPGEVVMDIGCGSGILSITAIKLGAVHALAVDISEEAVDSTRENASINDIAPAILETGKGSVEEILTGRFMIQKAPLVLVNILAPVITRLFELELGNLVSRNGRLLLSGILEYQVEDVLVAAGEKGFKEIERLSQDDWIALAMKKT
ncbi:MAG: 50S ribosomal protein L11 methyltransferase [Chloroflexota bacterium]|nr:50S ribosomal protein L11 methyltransferase [Chloroflexota bacterium]